MDVRIKELPKSKIEVKVKLSGEELSPYLTIGATEISKSIDIPGFRSGKAPQTIIEGRVGKKRILDEGAKIALNKSFSKIIEERKLEILGRPIAKIQKLSQEGLEALIEIAILPKVKLPSWREIAKNEPQNKIEVNKEEVEGSLKYLQKSRAKFIRKIRSAQKGDLIQMDYEIRSDGVKIENGDIKNQKFILGEGKFLPGFEENLIGSKENEEKEFSLSAPADFWKKKLRGRILDFKVKIKGIFKVELPELNNEWVRSLGKFDNLSQLRDNLLEGIKREKEEEEKRRWGNAVLDRISQETKIDLPDILVERERDRMIENLKIRVEDTGISFGDYLSHLRKSLEDLKKDFLPEAEKRVKILLSLYQIAREEKVDISGEEIEKGMNEFFKKYPTISRELRNNKEKEGNLRAYLEERMLQSKVMKLLSLETGQE